MVGRAPTRPIETGGSRSLPQTMQEVSIKETVGTAKNENNASQ